MLAVPLIAPILLCGCKGPDPRVETARSQLETMADVNSRSPHRYHREHLVPVAKRGLQILDSGEPARRPVLLMAAIRPCRSADATLGMMFFDAGFEVCGGIVENDKGFRRTFDAGYTEFRRKWYARTILRDWVEAIDFPDDPSTGGRILPPHATPIRIPRSALQSKVTVSITDKDGSKLSSVEAYVAPILTATTRPSPG